jgi:hypothetical protein
MHTAISVIPESKIPELNTYRNTIGIPLGIPSKAAHLIVHTLPKVVCISSPHPEYLIIHYHDYGKLELLSPPA